MAIRYVKEGTLLKTPVYIIDTEYNKRLDRQRPCLEGDFNGGSNNTVQLYKVTNQFDAGDKQYL